jgi:hypothetical protein
MSNYSRYYNDAKRRIEALAARRAAAEEALADAQRNAEKHPAKRDGYRDAAAAAAAARAAAALAEARAELEATVSEIKEIRQANDDNTRKLAAELEVEYSATDTSPETGRVLALLNTGALTSRDYRELYNQAKAAGNHTVIRVLGKCATDAAEARSRSHPADDAEAIALRAVAFQCGELHRREETAFIESLGYISEFLSRAERNPDLLQHSGIIFNTDSDGSGGAE